MFLDLFRKFFIDKLISPQLSLHQYKPGYVSESRPMLNIGLGAKIGFWVGFNGEKFTLALKYGC